MNVRHVQPLQLTVKAVKIIQTLSIIKKKWGLTRCKVPV
jgi:hypothetical protein